MKSKPDWKMAAITVVTTLLASLAFQWALSTREAMAQKKEIKDSISAKEVRVVDDAGNTRILASASQKFTGLGLYDKDGKVMGILHIKSDGLIQLAMYDKNNVARIMLGVSSDGIPGLLLDGKDSKEGVSLFVTGDGPSLAITDKNSKERVGIYLNNQNPLIELSDKDGKTIWSAPK